MICIINKDFKLIAATMWSSQTISLLLDIHKFFSFIDLTTSIYTKKPNIDCFITIFHISKKLGDQIILVSTSVLQNVLSA